MKFVLFYHAFASCWNHGNAHFLRGVARELIRLGHHVTVYEPESGWSRINALREDGAATALEEAARLVPGVQVHLYRSDDLDLEYALDGADVVIVHEWNPPELVAALGNWRAFRGRCTLLFHDTHHRAVTAPHELARFDLDGYDGILAFGEVLREVYQSRGWGRRVFTWHEAADIAVFRPYSGVPKQADLIWVGNWGDDERTRELQDFLLEPVSRLRATAQIHGVRYPDTVREELAQRGIKYAGWLPNHRAPAAFARARIAIHVPRRPYVEALPGIPTIRVFEALACGIPLASSPWDDIEALFPPGAYLVSHDSNEMTAGLSLLLRDRSFAQELALTGLKAIRDRHTCAHRVAELLTIVGRIKAVQTDNYHDQAHQRAMVTS